VETVDVVIATYGNADVWEVLAQRALASAEGQTRKPDAIYRAHDSEGADLSTARNQAAADSNADWLIFLDADDELDVHYVDSMLAGVGDLRWPSTLGVVDGREDDYPVLLQPKEHILIGNHMVIGTMVRRELFTAVGGFRAGLPVLEDWDLWIRCLLAGGVARPCPAAIYRVHVRSESRNTVANGHHRYYVEIQAKYQGLI
jgi:glycosyltransferase involved in cell wall biosynthesis